MQMNSVEIQHLSDGFTFYFFSREILAWGSVLLEEQITHILGMILGYSLLRLYQEELQQRMEDSGKSKLAMCIWQ